MLSTQQHLDDLDLSVSVKYGGMDFMKVLLIKACNFTAHAVRPI